MEKENAEQKRRIDFKMVTFSLAGRDYGVDIMKVKEISKISRFTYVPNTYPFVRGVHNLRGEIISIIDMRTMFNLDIKQDKNEKGKSAIENVLILKLKDSLLGVIVDSIDKVIGIASEMIKPPPALFTDINIKYISGVIEYEDKLYIILDSDRIFSGEDHRIEYETFEETEPVSENIEKEVVVREKEAPEFGFIVETLATFRHFYVTGLNLDWVSERFKEWSALCKSSGREVQLRNVEDADEFLKPFFSPYTGNLWQRDYMEVFSSLLPERPGGTIAVWNPGCGKGLETYSLACILRHKYPEARIKVWANDNSLIEISTAPNIVLADEDIPDYIKDGGYIAKTEKGSRFTKEIEDIILFEYHDVLHENAIPLVDIIVARDFLSFLKPDNQEKIVAEFKELLKADGMLCLGQNERLVSPEWKAIEEKVLTVYNKTAE